MFAFLKKNYIIEAFYYCTELHSVGICMSVHSLTTFCSFYYTCTLFSTKKNIFPLLLHLSYSVIKKYFLQFQINVSGQCKVGAFNLQNN